MKNLHRKTIKKEQRRIITKLERKAVKKGFDSRSVKLYARKNSGYYIYMKGKSVIAD